MTQFFFWIVLPLAIALLAIYVGGRCLADREKHPYDFKSAEKRESFERWHDHQVEQLGAAGNTLFALSAAALGYGFTLLSDRNQSLVNNNPTCIRLFISAFAISLILGLISIFNRLEDFRRTKRRHRLRDENPSDPEIKTLYRTTRRIGAWSWGLLYVQAFCFAVGSVMIIFLDPQLCRQVA